MVDNMNYFTLASRKGFVGWRQFPFPLCVVESPEKSEMIGLAAEVGLTRNLRAVWQLQVRGLDVPGLFTLVDGRFELIASDLVLSGLPDARSALAPPTSMSEVRSSTWD
jgi:hypothetical protein